MNIVIASTGGSPSDTNFYQSQKAYDIVPSLIKNSGSLFLMAECTDGVGLDKYAKEGIKPEVAIVPYASLCAVK